MKPEEKYHVIGFLIVAGFLLLALAFPLSLALYAVCQA